jgi:hypothetical protein
MIMEETISDEEAGGAMDASELMKPNKLKQATEIDEGTNKRKTMTKQLVSRPIEIPIAPIAPAGFDCVGFAEKLLDEILEHVAMIAD